MRDWNFWKPSLPAEVCGEIWTHAFNRECSRTIPMLWIIKISDQNEAKIEKFSPSECLHPTWKSPEKQINLKHSAKLIVCERQIDIQDSEMLTWSTVCKNLWRKWGKQSSTQNVDFKEILPRFFHQTKEQCNQTTTNQ